MGDLCAPDSVAVGGFCVLCVCVCVAAVVVVVVIVVSASYSHNYNSYRVAFRVVSRQIEYGGPA